MDIRELPRILLKEFCPDATHVRAKDVSKNKGEFWEGLLTEGVGITVYDNLPMHAKCLKIWLERECGMEGDFMIHPPLFEIYVGPEFLYHDQVKGNIRRDKATIHWPIHDTNLKGELYISLVCKIIIRAQELIASGGFEFPTYAVSSEFPDGVRIPI